MMLYDFVSHLFTVNNVVLEILSVYFRKGSGFTEGRNRKSFDKQDSVDGKNGGITTEPPREEILPEKEDSVNEKTQNTENITDSDPVAKVVEKPPPNKVKIPL
jgi:hypothetical protein